MKAWPADHIQDEHFNRNAAAGGEAFVVNAVRGGVTCNLLEDIPDHRDTFQTEKEKAANTQLAICCSRAKSSVLVLDI